MTRPAPLLDDLLDRWTVLEPGVVEDASAPTGDWYAVADEVGIKAYFAEPADAYRWRLDMINRELNP